MAIDASCVVTCDGANGGGCDSAFSLNVGGGGASGFRVKKRF